MDNYEVVLIDANHSRKRLQECRHISDHLYFEVHIHFPDKFFAIYVYPMLWNYVYLLQILFYCW
jgi:hypothetical protein